MRLEFWVKWPKSNSQSFIILRRVDRAKAYKVEDARLEAINRDFKAGALDFDAAKKAVLAVLRDIRGDKEPEQSSESNQALLAAYWSAQYPPERKIDDSSRRSARYALEATIRALGTVDLRTAPAGAIVARLNQYPPHKQRVYAMRCSSLLRFCGRPERIKPVSETKESIRFIRRPELLVLAEHLPSSEWKALVLTAFATGMRWGELFHLESFNPKNAQVNVHFQRTRDWQSKLPKWKKKRIAPVIPGLEAHVSDWVRVSAALKKEMRNAQGSKIVRQACRDAKLPEISFHDLRHSYAIHLLENEVPMTWVAQALGDGIEVATEHYGGFALTDPSAIAVRDILKRSGG